VFEAKQVVGVQILSHTILLIGELVYEIIGDECFPLELLSSNA
jgi:hypothetical protein